MTNLLSPNSLLSGLWYPESEAEKYVRLIANQSALQSTKPHTKMVEVWRVEYARLDGGPAANTVTCEVLAKDEADRLRVVGATCIRVTGPHQQEVPA